MFLQRMVKKYALSTLTLDKKNIHILIKRLQSLTELQPNITWH